MKSNKKISVSVVVPFYNRSKFLKRLLDSVASQTLPADKIYIIDNGSSLEETLQAWQIITTHKLVDKCVFTSSIGRYNANFARNLGYELATTKYVAFLDSDDWWEKEHLSISLDHLSKSNKVAVYSGAIFHTKDGEFKKKSIDVNQFDNPFDLILSSAGYMAVTPSYIVNRRLVGKDVLWDTELKRHQDFDYFASIFYNTSGWCYSPEIKVHVDWKDGGTELSNIDYDSLIRFYKKWHTKIPSDIKKDYLISRLYFASKNNAPKQIIKFYRSELKAHNFFDDTRCKIKANAMYVKGYNGAIFILNKTKMKTPLKNAYRIIKSNIIKDI